MKKITYIILAVFFALLSACAPASVTATEPQVDKDTADGAATFCATAPLNGETHKSGYGVDRCFSLISSHTIAGYFDKTDDIPSLPKLPERQTKFYNALYLFCRVAPADLDTTFLNAYSKEECQDLVTQAVELDYFGQFEAGTIPQ